MIVRHISRSRLAVRVLHQQSKRCLCTRGDDETIAAASEEAYFNMQSKILRDVKYQRLLDRIARELPEDPPAGYTSPAIQQASKVEEDLSDSEYVNVDSNVFPEDTKGTGYPRQWAHTALTREVAEERIMPPNPYTPKVQYDRRYRTVVNDPLKHEQKHVGKFYFWEKEQIDKFPEGLCGRIPEYFEVTGENGMMVRQTGRELVKLLHAFKQGEGHPGPEPVEQMAKQPEPIASKLKVKTSYGHAALEMSRGSEIPPALMLTGKRGVGKSTILNYSIQYARDNGWIVLLVPSARDLLERGANVQPSRRRGGYFDTHDHAYRIVGHLLEAHGEELSQLPQTGQYRRDWYLPPDEDRAVASEKEKLRKAEVEERRRLRAEAEAQGETWDPSTFESKLHYEYDPNQDRSNFTVKDMLEWCQRHPPYSTEALEDIMQELSRQEAFPVLVVVDEANHLYDENTKYPHKGSFIPTEKLTIIDMFRVFDTNGFREDKRLRRGMHLQSISMAHKNNLNRMAEQAQVDQHVRVPVPRLSRREIFSQLLHQATSERFFMLQDPEAIDAHSVEFYRTMTDGNPEELMNVSMIH